jgi:ribosomal protein S27AE
MEEHETEIAYWAGRLFGYDQAWKVAKEIVETIKKAQNQALRIHDVVGRSEHFCPVCDTTLKMNHDIDRLVCKKCKEG